MKNCLIKLTNGQTNCYFSPFGNAKCEKVLRSIECVPLEKAFSKMRNDDLKIYKKMLSSNDAKEGIAHLLKEENLILKVNDGSYQQK